MAFSFECAKGGIIAAGIYLFGSLQHSPCSPAFKPDGTVNQPVKHVVELQKMDIPVKKARVASSGAFLLPCRGVESIQCPSHMSFKYLFSRFSIDPENRKTRL